MGQQRSSLNSRLGQVAFHVLLSVTHRRVLCSLSFVLPLGWEPKWWLVDLCVFVGELGASLLAAEWSVTGWTALLHAGQVILNFGSSRAVFFSLCERKCDFS